MLGPGLAPSERCMSHTMDFDQEQPGNSLDSELDSAFTCRVCKWMPDVCGALHDSCGRIYDIISRVVSPISLRSVANRLMELAIAVDDNRMA